MKTIRDTAFRADWIDKEPTVPVPKADWINWKNLDIAYGDDPLQQFDLYYPNSGEGPYPLCILVHGGGFMLCDKRDWHLYPGFFALEKGFALASVNYRLTPASPFPAALEDICQVIEYLHSHAQEQMLDQDKVVLFGTSAGGNLVSVAGLEDRSNIVKAVAVLCPLVDLIAEQVYVETIDQQNPLRMMLEGAFVPYLGAMPMDNPDFAAQAGILSHVWKTPPPFYIQHGDRDAAVPVRQAFELADALRHAGGKVVLDILQDVDHAGAGPEFLEECNVIPIINFFKMCCERDAQGVKP
ncbi:MAG TPA: hypothetical protein DCM45_02175 [Clostridiales bacterium]|nr:hypothetical protein [Clostridiales bacterium]